jgi:DNA primase
MQCVCIHHSKQNYSATLLPDGRIFGQITQNRHQKIFLDLGKNGGRKTSNFFSSKSDRKEAEKY